MYVNSARFIAGPYASNILSLLSQLFIKIGFTAFHNLVIECHMFDLNHLSTPEVVNLNNA